MLNVFLTASDVNIGKNFIAAGIAATMQSLGYCTGVFKPVETGVVSKSGFAQSPDMTFVKTIDPYIKTGAAYMLKSNESPVIAAEEENVLVDKINIKKEFEIFSSDLDCVVTQGYGGFMTPYAPNLMTSDVVKKLDLPIVIVLKPTESALNQVLLSASHINSLGLKLRGVLINDFPEKSTSSSLKHLPRLIEEYSGTQILGILPHFTDVKKMKPTDFITSILNGIDIESVFDVKISKLNLD